MARNRLLKIILTVLPVLLAGQTVQPAAAAQLIMFEQAGCPWCEAFDREIASVYPKTDEGQRAPLRRVDIAQPLPPDLAFIEVERLTPLFVLIDRGREVGRIRGYPGDNHFWGLLGILLKRLDVNGMSREHRKLVQTRLQAAQ